MSPLTLNDTNTRNNLNTPVASRSFTVKIGASSSLVSLSNENKDINGELTAIRTYCKSLTTDTTFSVRIKDVDGVVWHTQAGIAHNSSVVTYLTTPRKLIGNMTVEFVFPATEQSFAAVTELEAELIFS